MNLNAENKIDSKGTFKMKCWFSACIIYEFSMAKKCEN